MQFAPLYSLLSLSIFASVVVALHTSGVILPLYIYPNSGCSNWQLLKTAISQHPQVPFYVVINPSTGPGSGSQPDANYQTCISDLRTTAGSNKNVYILGYVSTNYGVRSWLSVTNDVTTYSGWGTTYRPDGIFFDDAATSNDYVWLYGGYSNATKNAFSPSGLVVLNPGTQPISTTYFIFSDIIVTVENYYTQFNNNSLTIAPDRPASKQAVILHTGPTDAPQSLINQLIASDQIKTIFITDFPLCPAYSNFPTSWGNFVNYVDSAGST